MSDFISTIAGKIINLDAVAFMTTRQRQAPEKGADAPVQLVIGFSSAASVGEGRLMPLSLVLDGEEALDFIDQLASRRVVVDRLREKLS